MYIILLKSKDWLFFSTVLDGAGAVTNTILVKEGGSATLKCPLTLPDEGSSAPVQVVEWVRQGYDIPVLIKFGAHSLRVHPKYEGGSCSFDAVCGFVCSLTRTEQ